MEKAMIHKNASGHALRKITAGRIAACAALFSLMMISVSCTESLEQEFINLSVNEYTFDHTGNEILMVKVTTNAGEWEAETADSFITIERHGKDSIEVTAKPNDSNNSLHGQIVFRAGNVENELRIEQMPAMFKGTFMDLPVTCIGTLSRNGRYYAYVNTILQSDGTYDDIVVIMDFETGETSSFDPPVCDGGEGIYDSAAAISDDGRSMILEHRGNSLSQLIVDGEKVKLGCRTGYYSPYIANFSADGSVVVGSCKREGDPNRSEIPCKWVNGEHIILEMPETDALGIELYNGVYLRGCSDDGSVIFGSEWSTFGLVYYKDDVMYNIGIDNCELDTDGSIESLIYMKASRNNISPDGKYITTTYRKGGIVYPVLINTVTNTFKYMESAPDCGGCAVTDEGLVFCATPATLASSGTVIDFNTGDIMTVEEWFLSEKGIILSNSRWVDQISTDGKLFGGRKFQSNNAGIQYPYWFIRVE